VAWHMVADLVLDMGGGKWRHCCISTLVFFFVFDSTIDIFVPLSFCLLIKKKKIIFVFAAHTPQPRLGAIVVGVWF
jgi:hypothetical protein